ncbi:MAG: hypothetical protein ABI123_00855 [Ginsengibacter sp.]
MSIKKNHERIRIVDHLITTKAKGNIDFIAKKLGLHRAATYLLFEELREEGFPISYSKKENRFYYSEKGKMVGYTFVRETEEQNPGNEKISGGGGVNKNILDLFSMSTYIRHSECNFVFGKVTKNHFLWPKVTIQTSLMLQ